MVFAMSHRRREIPWRHALLGLAGHPGLAHDPSCRVDNAQARSPATEQSSHARLTPFARTGGVVAMRVEDHYPAGKRWWLRLHEKGGKRHDMPVHHKLERFLDECLERGCISYMPGAN